ncbi:restriction endonuclease subunit S [Turicibacter sanguinis]|uniref:restriction endonuclease subunit S n=1 Tax=Turicibacter sanguinis TaxID=154288 RepID=UPI0018A00AEB|nr:restriction endonuclease subunit S [Turicibacter sanguinis]
MKSNYKLLGDYIQEVNVRNNELKDLDLLGISIQKEFIPSIANTIGTDMSKYKIVKKNQFAYGTVTSRNGDKISIALLQNHKEALISQAYISFEVIDENELLPEYLMMWFRRPEFDRYARYMSYGSAREVFSWEEMCNVTLPIPSIKKQREIVEEYNTILNRIKLNENVIGKLEDLAQSIYKQWFIDYEFITDKGEPYKASGGSVLSSEIGDIPEGWTIKTLEEIVDIVDNRGKTPPNINEETEYPLIEIASLRDDRRVINYDKCSKYIKKKTYESWFRSGHPKERDILISTVGSLAELKLFWGDKGCIAQNIVAFRSRNINYALYLYQYLYNRKNELLAYEIGSVQSSIKVSHIIKHPIIIPDEEVVKKYDYYASIITQLIYVYNSQISYMKSVKAILLLRIANMGE